MSSQYMKKPSSRPSRAFKTSRRTSMHAPDTHSAVPGRSYAAASRTTSSAHCARGKSRCRKSACAKVDRRRGKRRSGVSSPLSACSILGATRPKSACSSSVETQTFESRPSECSIGIQEQHVWSSSCAPAGVAAVREPAVPRHRNTRDRQVWTESRLPSVEALSTTITLNSGAPASPPPPPRSMARLLYETTTMSTVFTASR